MHDESTTCAGNNSRKYLQRHDSCEVGIWASQCLAFRTSAWLHDHERSCARPVYCAIDLGADVPSVSRFSATAVWLQLLLRRFPCLSKLGIPSPDLKSFWRLVRAVVWRARSSTVSSSLEPQNERVLWRRESWNPSMKLPLDYVLIVHPIPACGFEPENFGMLDRYLILQLSKPHDLSLIMTLVKYISNEEFTTSQ